MSVEQAVQGRSVGWEPTRLVRGRQFKAGARVSEIEYIQHSTDQWRQAEQEAQASFLGRVLTVRLPRGDADLHPSTESSGHEGRKDTVPLHVGFVSISATGGDGRPRFRRQPRPLESRLRDEPRRHGVDGRGCRWHSRGRRGRRR